MPFGTLERILTESQSTTRRMSQQNSPALAPLLAINKVVARYYVQRTLLWTNQSVKAQRSYKQRRRGTYHNRASCCSPQCGEVHVTHGPDSKCTASNSNDRILIPESSIGRHELVSHRCHRRYHGEVRRSDVELVDNTVCYHITTKVVKTKNQQ